MKFFLKHQYVGGSLNKRLASSSLLMLSMILLSACGSQNIGSTTPSNLQPASGAAATTTAEPASTVTVSQLVSGTATTTTAEPIAGMTASQPAPATITCSKQRFFSVGNTTVWQLPGRDAFFFKAGMAINADGAPDAYHPDDIGTDALANAGHPGNWWALVTHNGKRSGNPIVQKAGDPNPGYYIAMTAL